MVGPPTWPAPMQSRRRSNRDLLDNPGPLRQLNPDPPESRNRIRGARVVPGLCRQGGRGPGGRIDPGPRVRAEERRLAGQLERIGDGARPVVPAHAFVDVVPVAIAEDVRGRVPVVPVAAHAAVVVAELVDG